MTGPSGAAQGAGASFPPAARLLKPDEFTAALRGRRVARAQWLELYTPRSAPSETSRPAGARLGVVVAKRLAPRAVTRNTIKRVVREAFRQRRAGLPDADIVLRLHARVPVVSLNAIRVQVREDMAALLDVAGRRRPDTPRTGKVVRPVAAP